MFIPGNPNYSIPDRFLNKPNLHADPYALAAGMQQQTPQANVPSYIAGAGQTPMPASFDWTSGQIHGTGFGAAQQTQQDVQNASFNTPTATSQRNGTGNQGSGRGQNQPGASGTEDPGDYSSPAISGSPQWYGGLSNYGVQQALGSPLGFWSQYGSQGPGGWDPAGNSAAFMASRYDPFNLAMAMNPNNGGNPLWGDERSLAAMTGVANQLGGASSQAAFINPNQVIGGVLHAIATNDDNALMQVNPVLAQIIQSTKGNPAAQVDTLINFFQQILPSMMPKEMSDALLSQIQAVGTRWATGLGKPMGAGQFDTANFAQVLLQMFGNMLG